jgi:ADP-heptose:LPS heptosyltransferase
MAAPPSLSPPRLPPAEEVHRIACLMLGGIGDVLAATPATAALKALFPGAALTLILRRRLVPLAAANPHVDGVIAYDSASLWRRLHFVRALRRHRHDLWVDLHVPTFHTVASADKVFLRNALIMRAARTRYRLGYGARFLRSRLTHALPVPSHAQLMSENIVDTTLALLGPPPNTSRRKVMAIATAHREWAASRLPGTRAPRLGFFFGGRQSANHWPLPRATVFVRTFLAEYPGGELVLIGDMHETELADSLLQALDSADRARIVDLVGGTDLDRTAAVFERCDAAVCTDSGPMHIADAVGTPLVALFCGKNHLPIWVPTGERNVVLYHHVQCAPCFKSECPIDNLCMNEITAAEVSAALRQLLGPAA